MIEMITHSIFVSELASRSKSGPALRLNIYVLGMYPSRRSLQEQYVILYDLQLEKRLIFDAPFIYHQEARDCT